MKKEEVFAYINKLYNLYGNDRIAFSFASSYIVDAFDISPKEAEGWLEKWKKAGGEWKGDNGHPTTP